MNVTRQSVENIYFTSWQYVRIGGYDVRMSSGGSGVAWVNSQGRVLRPPCDAMGMPEDDSYRQDSTALSDDDIQYVSYSPHGVRLVAQPPATRLKFDDPLGMDPEASPVPISIIFDEGRYKCWYAFLPARRPTTPPYHQFNQHVCYAESTDGFKWHKPKLGLFEYEGRRDNNIVFSPYVPRVHDVFCPGVFIDPDGDPAERYKMIYYSGFTEEQCARYRKRHPDEFADFGNGNGGWGIAGAVSPDGVHWKLLDEPMLIHLTDIIWGSMAFDRHRRKYVLYYRSWPRNARSPEPWGVIGVRSVARATSTDFRHWENGEVIITTGADTLPSHVYYAAGQTWLPGSDDQQVMFIYRWKQEEDVEDLCLFSTPDGWAWSPVPGGTPIMTAGQPGTWDGSYIMGGAYLIELPGDRWVLPYQGFPIPHKYPRIAPAQRKLHPGVEANRGYAIWPKGRLVALECPDEGSFATVAFHPAGEKLVLNAAVEPAGYIRVGLRNLSGEIPGRALTDCDVIWGRNALEIPVTWKGDPQLSANGQPVIVCFELRRAKLFGMTFR